MSDYDSDLQAVLARFHNLPDTNTRKDILKKLSDNQLSRVVIQGVKCEFEREGLEEIALVMLGVISKDSCSKLAHDLDGEIEVALKHEEADDNGEVVIKMEPDSYDDNGVIMMRSKQDDSELATSPEPSTIASVAIVSSANRGREAQKHPDTIKERPARAEGTESASRSFMPKFVTRGPGMTNSMMRNRTESTSRGFMHNLHPHGPGQAAYLERFSNRDAAQTRYQFSKRPRWRV